MERAEEVDSVSCLVPSRTGSRVRKTSEGADNFAGPARAPGGRGAIEPAVQSMRLATFVSVCSRVLYIAVTLTRSD